MIKSAGNSERSAVSGASDHVEEARGINPPISQPIGKSDGHLFGIANETAQKTVSSQFDTSNGKPHPFEIADASKGRQSSDSIKGDDIPESEKTPWRKEHRVPKTDEINAWQDTQRAKQRDEPPKPVPTPPPETPEVREGAARILKALTPPAK